MTRLLMLMALLWACEEKTTTVEIQEQPLPQNRIPPPLPEGAPVRIPPPPAISDPNFFSFERQESDQLSVLESAGIQDRLNTRFLTICEQYNEGQRELGRFVKAVDKSLNAISTERIIEISKPVGQIGCVRSLDIRDYGLTPTKWRAIESRLRQLFGTTFESFTTRGQLIKQLTQTVQPAMPAHVFSFISLNNPVYAQLLELPGDLKSLEESLGVDLQANFDGEDPDTYLFGMTQSPISRTKPRLALATKSDEGFYYLTYDSLDRNIGKVTANPFESPFPVEARSNRTLIHDGSEAIFSLPNGMMGFYLSGGADANFEIQNIAPFDLVNDPGAASRGLSPEISYLSCHDCHELGIIERDDEIATKVLRDSSFNAADKLKVQFWHGRSAALKAKMRNDNNQYFEAIAKMQIGRNEKDHINAYTNRLRQEATVEQVAALMSQTPEEFKKDLAGSPQSLEQIGQLLNGDTVTLDQLRITLQTYVIEANRFRNKFGE